MNPSNCLVVNGDPVLLPVSMTALGITCSNFVADDQLHFQSRKRKKPVSHVVIHESAGGVDGYRTIRGLHKRGLGVHIVIHPDGSLTNHADLILDRLIHANQLNHTSVGIEVINPYLGARVKKPFDKVVDGKWWTWKKKGYPHTYCVPTNAQMLTIKLLAPVLSDLLPDCPLAFPTAGLNKRQTRIDGWKDSPKAKPGPGWVAHRDFATHADGRYILERLIEFYGETAIA